LDKSEAQKIAEKYKKLKELSVYYNTSSHQDTELEYPSQATNATNYLILAVPLLMFYFGIKLFAKGYRIMKTIQKDSTKNI